MSEMKKKTKQASGGGQKREAEEALPVPTLGQVAEEERFVSLRGLLQPVALTPVKELLSEGGEGLRNWLQEEAGKVGQLPVALAFFAACSVQTGAATLKRAHVVSGEKSPGRQRRERLLFSLFVRCFSCALLGRVRRMPRRHGVGSEVLLRLTFQQSFVGWISGSWCLLSRCCLFLFTRQSLPFALRKGGWKLVL